MSVYNMYIIVNRIVCKFIDFRSCFFQLRPTVLSAELWGCQLAFFGKKQMLWPIPVAVILQF